jgi:arylsulfatase A-like enzyme
MARRTTRRLGPPTLLIGTGGVLVTIAVGLWVAAGADWQTPTGVGLGRLPAGIGRADLNVLLVTLDTTRADRLAAYGFSGIQTPFLDRLAREGVRFDQTASAAPLTLPAHCSLFTGRLPPQHGVRENGMVLQSSEVTLAAILKAHGFQTAAITASFVVGSQFGLNQGFDEYLDALDDSGDGGGHRAGRALRRPANDVADRALDWLQAHERSRFFAWLHFYDAHAPYEPPEPYRTRYAADPYLGEIAFVDEQLGRVLRFLDARHLLDRTIVVVIGDHGESLGEHGERTHGLFVYEGVLRVPFIIRAPFTRLGGRHVDEPTRSIDMMPTVLDLLGIGPPATQGRSLAGLMTGAERDLGLETYSESMYPRDHFGWSDLHATRAGRFKVIVAPRPELYDLAADPHELRNLYPERKLLGDRMAARVRAVADVPGDPEPPDVPSSSPPGGSGSGVDSEARARLAALGYVGGSTERAVGNQTGLPDPKDRIDLYNLITAAPATLNAAARRSGARGTP